jgi:hypothetical protein
LAARIDREVAFEMKKRLLIAGFVVLIVLSVFLFKKFQNKQEDGKLSLSGNVEVTEVNAGFKYPGRIAELPVEEGQQVKKGDRLAALESADIEAQVTQSRAYLDEAKTKLEELRAGSRPQEIEQAKANVRYAEAELSKARKDFERAEHLFKNGAMSAQNMDAARKAYDSAASQHHKALEALSLTKEGPRKEQISAAEQRVKQAESGLEIIEERLKDTVLNAALSLRNFSRSMSMPSNTEYPSSIFIAPLRTIWSIRSCFRSGCSSAPFVPWTQCFGHLSKWMVISGCQSFEAMIKGNLSIKLLITGTTLCPSGAGRAPPGQKSF